MDTTRMPFCVIERNDAVIEIGELLKYLYPKPNLVLIKIHTRYEQFLQKERL
jgi:hypothetical protein